jgi:hypothetical protein
VPWHWKNNCQNLYKIWLNYTKLLNQRKKNYDDLKFIIIQWIYIKKIQVHNFK